MLLDRLWRKRVELATRCANADRHIEPTSDSRRRAGKTGGGARAQAGNVKNGSLRTGEVEDVEMPPAPAQDREARYPVGVKLFLILLSLMTSMFLVALDRLIIATAIPQITDDFRSVTDVGWYGSAFLLTNCAFQLLFGKLYAFWSVKRVFLASVLLFEAGSAVCGAACSSVVFIVGRAVSGVGGAGIFSGAIVILVHSVPLHKRPMYQGLFGAIFGTASVVGPLLGGALTTNVSWRWCFYINLPFGGLAIAIIMFCLDIPSSSSEPRSASQAQGTSDEETCDSDGLCAVVKRRQVWGKLRQLDFAGTSVFMPGVVCLLLVLQWGGVDYPWKNGRIIALLVLAIVLLAIFIGVQIYLPDTATVPPRILSQRSMISAFLVAFCIGSHMMIFVYFLPIWFQAIQLSTALSSGLKTLPLVLSLVLATTLSGALVTRTGHYAPPLHAGTLLAVAGAALLTTLRTATPSPRWIGYQVLYGFGLGFGFQVPNVAAQTVLRGVDVPVGTALVMFAQLLGGAVFVSVGQRVLTGELAGRLSGVEGFDVEVLREVGVTGLAGVIGGDEEVRGEVMEAYNEALRRVFRVGLVMACLAVLGGSFMEWRSVKKKPPGEAMGRKSKKRGEAGTGTGESQTPETPVEDPQKGSA